MNRKALEKQLETEYRRKLDNKINNVKLVFSNAMNNNDFKKTYQNIRNLDLEIAKTENSNTNTAALKSQLLAEKKKLQKITEKLKISKDDFKISYDCEKCKDTGKINGEYCSCFKNKIHNGLLRQTALQLDAKHTFEQYDENIATSEEQRKQLWKMKELFITYAEKYPNVKNKNILLCGNTGVGKTFLIECLANELVKNNQTINLISAFQMNTLFLNYHTTFQDDKSKYLESLLDVDVLLIDDLGTEPINKNVTKEYLYTIISERMNEDKAIIITTNLMPADILERYGERIFSRLNYKNKSLIIQLKGTDIRLNKK